MQIYKLRQLGDLKKKHTKKTPQTLKSQYVILNFDLLKQLQASNFSFKHCVWFLRDAGERS